MRCITLTKNEKSGIRLTKRGSRYIVWSHGVDALAYVTFEDFDEMLSRGQASNQRLIELEHSFQFNLDFGPIVYRCDSVVDEKGKVRLVPEKDESKNVLIWAPRFCNYLTTRAIKYLPSEPIATQLDFWQRQHMLILLTPGNPISWFTHTTKAVPGTGRSWRHPLRRAKREWDVVLLRRLQINQDGELFG